MITIGGAVDDNDNNIWLTSYYIITISETSRNGHLRK